MCASSLSKHFFGRKTGALLPIGCTLENEAAQAYEEIHTKQRSMQERQKRYFDRDAKDLPPLPCGSEVRIQPFEGHRWGRGTVIKQVDPKSYLVRRENGSVERRNRKHLRHTKEQSLTDPNGKEDEAEYYWQREETTEEITERNTPEPTTKPMNTPEPIETHNEETNKTNVTTRSGRVVRKPRWLADYDMS